MTQSPPSKSITICNIAAILAVAVGFFLQYLHWDFDDAMIAYRVISNLRAGHGWVYNPGEMHNASTSVLNTFAIWLLARPLNDIPLAAHVLGLFSMAGTGILVYLALRPANWFLASLGAVAVMRRMVGVTYWGLETYPFIALMFLFVHLEKRGAFTWPLLGCITLTRPDGALLAVMKWLKEVVRQKSFSLAGIVAYAAVLAPWAVYAHFRLGKILPDTLSQKIWQGRSGLFGEGLIYLRGLVNHYTVEANLITQAALVLAVIATARLARKRDDYLFLVLFCAAQQAAYCVLNVPPYRWYMAYLDVLIVFLAAYCVVDALFPLGGRPWFPSLSNGASRLLERIRPAWPRQALAALLLSAACVYAVICATTPQYNARDLEYTAISKQVEAAYPPERFPGELAATEVGSIGFHTSRPIVDIIGLTSVRGPYVTPESMDEFFAAPPRFVLLHAPPWRFETALYNDPRFGASFACVQEYASANYPMRLFMLRGADK